MPPKSGFSRAKNIDYDDDDAYDDEYYEEEEAAGDGLTEDDKEQMRVGTAGVRAALGEFEAGVSDAQIQEALWHYYYDVGKSVTYLKNKLGGVQAPSETAPKKEKAVSKFDQVASAAAQKAPTSAGKHAHMQNSVSESACPIAPSLLLPPTTMPLPTRATDDFFWDVPWGNVPENRRGVITIEPPHYRGGLLGGSSKLAALAAKRRKEREEAETASRAAPGKENGEADAAIAMLDKLSVRSGNATSARGGELKPRYPMRKRSPSPQPEAAKEEPKHKPEAPQPAVVVESPAERAAASTFASTLCGTTAFPQPTLLAFPVPYPTHKGYDSADAFSKPSPDDVVREAQAKVAGGGRR
jgi:elongation factor 1 alpha-like protein